MHYVMYLCMPLCACSLLYHSFPLCHFLFSVYVTKCVYFVHCGFHVRNNTLPDSHAPLWHSGVHGYYNLQRL